MKILSIDNFVNFPLGSIKNINIFIEKLVFLMLATKILFFKF